MEQISHCLVSLFVSPVDSPSDLHPIPVMNTYDYLPEQTKSVLLLL